MQTTNATTKSEKDVDPGNDVVDVWSAQINITSGCKLKSAGSPALASMNGRLYVVARQSGDLVQWTSSDDGLQWVTPPQTINNVQAASGVGLTAVENVLHMVYRQADSSDIYYCTMQQDETWTTPVNLGALYNCKTSKSPAIAYFNDKLYMVFRGKSSDQLYCSRRSLDHDAWSAPESITDGLGAKTSKAPALGVHEADNRLYLVYRGKDSSKIWSCYLDPDTDIWFGQGPITEDTRRGTHPETSEQVGLAEYDKRLYMAFRGKDSGTLWSSSFGEDEWYSQTRITSQNDAMTQSGPALAAHGKLLFMAYRGNSSDNLYCCCLHNPRRG